MENIPYHVTGENDEDYGYYHSTKPKIAALNAFILAKKKLNDNSLSGLKFNVLDTTNRSVYKFIGTTIECNEVVDIPHANQKITVYEFRNKISKDLL